jgi:hypothetical protein
MGEGGGGWAGVSDHEDFASVTDSKSLAQANLQRRWLGMGFGFIFKG